MAAVDIGPISGFPEWTPGQRRSELAMLDTIRAQYELFGFTPIETPAVERMDVLTAKGGVQRQIYAVGRPEEMGDEDISLALHFDLTVPLARYVAHRAEELTFPFRRYQMQKVWRGERPQRGRFREFYQCDVDIIGHNSLDSIHDAEIPCVINATFEALGLPEFKVHVSNRKVWNDLFDGFGVSPELRQDVLRQIDKLQRDGIESVLQALTDLALADDLFVAARSILEDPTSIESAKAVFAGVSLEAAGLEELESCITNAIALGMPPARIAADLTITRGLDYYTGTVYETFVTGNEQWGSICSGGRYDDLASYFTTRKYPGVGISIGLTRLLDLLTKGGYRAPLSESPTHVLVTMQNRDKYQRSYLSLAATLRRGGIPSEVYLEPAALRDQVAYASAKGIPLVIIAGHRELEHDVVTIRDLRYRTEELVTGDTMVDYIEEKLRN